ncbi:MAG: MBL fold metallo-hydrolase [Flavobacteriaceae bacterium]
MKIKSLTLVAIVTLLACKNDQKTTNSEVEIETVPVASEEPKQEFTISPISHATMVLTWDGKTLYVDPVGGGDAFTGYKAPDLILVTDIHGDHLNVETLEAVTTETTKLLVPQAVANELSEGLLKKSIVIHNGETQTIEGFSIEAIPMYNLREEALKFHEKGRGNGYVIEKDDRRVYLSGDTEDIPEMRALQNIDVAFVCMNLPYTMTVESAADAVLAFAPVIVYPYHYRGGDGLSDVAKFKQLVNEKNPSIIVTQLNWYRNQEASN